MVMCLENLVRVRTLQFDFVHGVWYLEARFFIRFEDKAPSPPKLVCRARQKVRCSPIHNTANLFIFVKT